ncbi:hypothetical protein [Exiguobacterium artemiae]|uniref:hypothetical protein n=1 Tax=Exiguobacterium artemiae TaxID=340145 RepID=UPI000B072B0A|nr:hypothetical protein [Exiguobacterium sibiricum]MDW2886705.1 hypothetical protein [Exiguobacterium sibiricum]
MFVINRLRPLGFRDSQHFSVEQLSALKNDIVFTDSDTFSGVFTGGTFFKTFGRGDCYVSLLVSRN